MDYSARLGLRGVLYIRMYVGLLEIYENTYLKPMDGKLQVEGINERRMSRFPIYYSEVEFYTSGFLSRGLSRGFLR